MVAGELALHDNSPDALLAELAAFHRLGKALLGTGIFSVLGHEEPERVDLRVSLHADDPGHTLVLPVNDRCTFVASKFVDLALSGPEGKSLRSSVGFVLDHANFRDFAVHFDFIAIHPLIRLAAFSTFDSLRDASVVAERKLDVAHFLW